ncbi:MAG TPA: hypothetical protein VFW66_11895 [Gemmatimonadales bacterium]|nr:hypothetical protein [Gemmatimonadales bacterium]
MILTLALRHLRVRKLRSLFLLAGFSLGVGVMIVLLSVGEAMLEQSRDVALVGGGEVTVLPQGIDVEAMRTGGVGGMFFGIDRARFLTRQFLGGPRHAGIVRAVSPAIENKLLYVARAGVGAVHPDLPRVLAVRAGGEIPSRARAVGTRLDLLAGTWTDSPADSEYVAPTAQQLYDELDRFHLPAMPDSTWAEWDYFNVVAGPREWWYVTFLVGGEVPAGPWGGQLLITHHTPAGEYQRFTARIPPAAIALDTAAADLRLGTSSVRQRDGVYHIEANAAGQAGRVLLELEIHPVARRYFPPVELRSDEFLSGYVVPALAATAAGRVCVATRCTAVAGAPAYHDHNWGVWRDVTWEWGAATGRWASILYGGVRAPGSAESGAPFFLTLVDSLGVRQVLRFRRILYEGAEPASGLAGVAAPKRFELLAAREADTVMVKVDVESALASPMRAEGIGRAFVQMRGRFTLSGTVAGRAVADSGSGFFETYTRAR